MGRFTGDVCLVTGAGRGFGEAIARRMAAEGAAVAVLARSRAQIDAVARAIEVDGGRAIAVEADVTSPADVDRAITEIESRLGPLTQFVNNAGVAGPFGPMWEVDPEEWWQAQAVHIRAPMLFLHRILPGMIARGKGRAIVVSALASRMVAPYLNAYCTGKIGQTRIVAEAAAELKDTPVKVFAIDPGFVFTALANETMTSPAAQRWLPGMVERLRGKANERADAPPPDLARCAQRCVDLLSGAYDGLSGQYMELDDNLDAMLRGEPAGHLAA